MIFEELDPDGPPPPVLGGRYALCDPSRPLGRGGFGRVYLAQDMQVGNQQVAVKLIRATGPDREGAFEQVNRRVGKEVQAQADAGEHDHVVRVIDRGFFAEERWFYVVTEFCNGGDLGRWQQQAGATASRREIAEAVAALCDAVQLLHDKGDSAHYDLKPGNVLLKLRSDKAGLMEGANPRSQRLGHYWAAVADFGLARSLEPEGGRSGEGAGFGSDGFMAPEQRRGEGDKRSDVYGLGGLLYFLLVGLPPNGVADSVGDEIAQQTGAPPVAQSGKRTEPAKFDDGPHRRLWKICEHALSDDPRRRYAKPKVLAEELQRWLRDEPTEATRPPVGPREHLSLAARRHRAGLTVFGVVMAVSIVGGIFALLWNVERVGRQVEVAEARAVAEQVRADAANERAKIAEELTQSQEAAIKVEKDRRLTAQQLASTESRLRGSQESVRNFLEDLLYGADTYALRGEQFTIDHLIDRAKRTLGSLSGDTAAAALAGRVMGRVSSNHRRYDDGVAMLETAASQWRQVVAEADAAGRVQESLIYRDELATCLNHLAWALVHNGHKFQTGGVDVSAERVDQALAIAHEAADLMLQIKGESDDDTLALRTDVARMLTMSGRPGEAVLIYNDVLATLHGRPSHQMSRDILGAGWAVVSHLRRGEREQAKAVVRSLLAPFDELEVPRLRYRLPWSLAQAGEQIAGFDPFWPFAESDLAAIGLVLGEIAAERNKVQNERPGDVNYDNIQSALDNLRELVAESGQ